MCFSAFSNKNKGNMNYELGYNVHVFIVCSERKENQ